jgi:hypothetical protein
MKDLDQSDVDADARDMEDLQGLQEWVKQQYPNVEVRRETVSDDDGEADGWSYFLYIPYNEFKWPEPGELFDVRCLEHKEGRWSTKGPQRNLHWLGYRSDKGDYKIHPEYRMDECPCKMDKMHVRVPLEDGWLKLEGDEDGPTGD